MESRNTYEELTLSMIWYLKAVAFPRDIIDTPCLETRSCLMNFLPVVRHLLVAVHAISLTLAAELPLCAWADGSGS